MNLLWLLVIVLVVIAVGGLPHWGYAQNWSTGYFPSAIGTILIIVLLVVLLR